jgi:hypothetical protein
VISLCLPNLSPKHGFDDLSNFLQNLSTCVYTYINSLIVTQQNEMPIWLVLVLVIPI